MRGGLTTKESARVGSREQVLARLKKIGVIAAMTEDDYVAQLRSKAAFYVVWAIVVAVAGSILSILAALSSD
jgi:hypothetical protein